MQCYKAIIRVQVLAHGDDPLALLRLGALV
jgi:hypothetical protein